MARGGVRGDPFRAEMQFVEQSGEGRIVGEQGVGPGLNQPVADDLRANRAADAVGGLEDADAMAALREPIRGGQAGDAGAEDGDGLGGVDHGL